MRPQLGQLTISRLAWVAERKDVLSAFLWVLTLYLYAEYVKKPALRRYTS